MSQICFYPLNFHIFAFIYKMNSEIIPIFAKQPNNFCEKTMKEFFLTLIMAFMVFTQGNVNAQTYQNLWKQVDEAAQQDLPQTQRGVLKQIVAKAEREAQYGHLLKALLTDATVTELKPIIDLRLGVKYNMNRWLSFYGQLNNYLHRFNDIYYGYQSQGINGEIGLTWIF